MQKIDFCPCCDGTSFRRFPASIAPFIEAYALEGSAPQCELLECRTCTFRFFNQRFDASESKRLYSDYRSDAYFRARHQHEYWYTASVHNALSGDPAVILARRDYVASFLARHLSGVAIDSVLDYGGDRGQFIPDGIALRKFVYELSDAVPEHDVTRIAGGEVLQSAAPFSLVMLCHVLEHIADPMAVIAEIRGLLEAGKSYLLIEVPYERHDLSYSLPTATSKILPVVLRHKYLRLANDVYTLYFRHRWNLIPPLGISRLHEHINFFSEESLRHLLIRSGLTVLGHTLVEMPAGRLSGRSLLMLAYRPG